MSTPRADPAAQAQTARPEAPPLSCRAVSPEEVGHYAEHGWTRLPGLLPPETVAALKARAIAAMGEDGQGNAVSPFRQDFFNPEPTGGLNDPQIRPLITGFAANAKQLMARRPEIGVRYFGDMFAAKLPQAWETAHPGAGATHCHQDFTNWALDRSGGMTFWVALDDLTEESGTMSFYSGSHALGVLGHYQSYTQGLDLLDDFPEIAVRCPKSGPHTYRAGDATVHSVMLAHSAGANLTDQPRWAYLVMMIPEDARWNGAPPQAFDTAGMTHLQLLDDRIFPVIG